MITWIIFSWTFSHTLGTPKNTVGRASFRVATRVPFNASLLAKYTVPRHWVAMKMSMMFAATWERGR